VCLCAVGVPPPIFTKIVKFFGCFVLFVDLVNTAVWSWNCVSAFAAAPCAWRLAVAVTYNGPLLMKVIGRMVCQAVEVRLRRLAASLFASALDTVL
jgi:hypothetical protein